MSSSIATPDRQTARDPLPCAAAVERIPFYFESQHQSLFAWLHRCEDAPYSDHGVIVCPPIGYEQVHAHRSLRHIADALATAGLPCVRFDLHGTGDSGGSDEDWDRVITWLANIKDAEAWLTRQLGCKRISLLGLRLGATLAAHAASSEEIDGLVLWAPVVKGRAYVREMKALSLTSAAGAGQSAATPDEIEAAGFVLTAQTARDLSGLDLLQSRPLCRRALLVERDDNPVDTRVLDHFKQCGIEAEQTIQPGYTDMMAEPHYSQVPRTAIAHIANWLAASNVGQYLRANVIQPDVRLESLSYAALQPTPWGQVRECVLHIGQQPQLFGILSEPLTPAKGDLPIVVLINAGSSYRVGPNRLYASLARQLAAEGFRSVRLDLGGLGDSVSPATARENDPYPATAFRDIDRTLKHLRTQLGAERVVLMGLCSGAYAAFQSAAQLDSSTLVESVLINPLTFFWREGMSLDAAPALQLRTFQECMNSAWQPGKLLKLLSGRSKIGIGRALKILVQRWRLRSLPSTPLPDPACNAVPDGLPSHPKREDLQGDLDRVVKANRHLTCFFARSDPGFGILTFHARRKVNELCRAGKLSLHFIDDADHTFSRHTARRALGQAIAKHLGGRYRRSCE